MDTLTGLRDIVRNVGTIPDINIIRITSLSSGNHIEAVYDNHLVVLGKMQEPIDGANFTIGLVDLQLFKKTAECIGHDISTLKVEIHPPSTNIPAHISFTSSSGTDHKFQLLSGASVDAFTKRQIFQGGACQASFTLKQKDIDLLSYWYKALEDIKEERVYISSGGAGKLCFKFMIGLENSNVRKFNVGQDVVGTLIRPRSYMAKDILNVWKLYRASQDFKIHISDAGFLRMDVNSGLGLYQFYLFAESLPIYYR